MALILSNNKMSMLSLALVLCLFLIVSSAESRLVRTLGNGNGKPDCDTVYGIKPINQCTGIMEAFDLSVDEFFAINPNLNCNAIFVGQWVCVSGSA